MANLFSADFFAANRARLRQALPDEPIIVVTANGLLQRSADSSFPFQQDSNFWYLTGVDDPDVILVLSAGSEYLIVPSRSTSRQAFDGTLDGEDLAATAGLQHVLDEAAGWDRLIRQLRKTRQLATPLPTDSYIAPYGLYANPARRRFTQRCNQAVPGIVLSDIRLVLGSLRMTKQPPELAAIQQAIDITSQTLQEIIGHINDYTHEYQIEADLSQGFRRRGARGHAFEPIVAGGANACTLHNVANNDPLHQHELVVMDVGAEVSHYAADITRTIAYGQPTPRQQAVYQAVLTVQNQAKALLKPGVLLKDYEIQVEQLIGAQLRQLQVIKTDDRADIRRYYPHAASHFLGLDVHDVGQYQEPLTAGTVLTVEPGIYIPEEAIGVRIEDDILITKSGNQVLSADLPYMLQ